MVDFESVQTLERMNNNFEKLEQTFVDFGLVEALERLNSNLEKLERRSVDSSSFGVEWDCTTE